MPSDGRWVLWIVYPVFGTAFVLMIVLIRRMFSRLPRNYELLSIPERTQLGWDAFFQLFYDPKRRTDRNIAFAIMACMAVFIITLVGFAYPSIGGAH